MTGQPHAERAHAAWSASAASRNMACAGALALSQLAPEQPESEAAAWGTAAHEVAEWALNNGTDCADYPHLSVATKEHVIPFDDEIAACAQEYVDYVRLRQSGEIEWQEDGRLVRVYDAMTDVGYTLSPAAWLKVEQKFSLADINPPIEAGGTADAVLYFPSQRLLEVVDLKGGRGVVVEAKGNDQLRHYALGALLANPGLDVRLIRVTIVQPRAGHPEGRIRSERFHAADLFDWTADLLDHMHDAYAVLYARNGGVYLDPNGPARPMPYPIRPVPEVQFNPGNHCIFCPAKQAMLCPAIEKKALDDAGIWFSPQGDPQLPSTEKLTAMTPEKLSMLLDVADFVESYFNAARAFAHAQAESGVVIPNYQLVAKQGRAKWREDAEDQIYTLAGEDAYERKLRSPAHVRGVLKDRLAPEYKTKKDAEAAAKRLLEPLTVSESTGTNLVRVDKTTRQAVPAKAERFFSPVIEGQTVADASNLFD